MRWACRAIADRIGADHQDDTLYLFWPEIMDVSAGRRPYDAGLRSLIEQRKQYFDYWLQRRPSLPKMVGTVPSQQDWFSSDVKVYQTMVSIDEHLPGLKPGMTAEVTIFTDSHSDHALTVPIQAILGGADLGSKRKVYVLTPTGP